MQSVLVAKVLGGGWLFFLSFLDDFHFVAIFNFVFAYSNYTNKIL